jgi:uncharacterized protein (DUF2345 family)
MAETLKRSTDRNALELIQDDGDVMPNVRTTEDEVLIDAERKLTLRCGKSSITLYPNGKIVLRGEYILSDAEGVNRIAGGRIELN